MPMRPRMMTQLAGSRPVFKRSPRKSGLSSDWAWLSMMACLRVRLRGTCARPRARAIRDVIQDGVREAACAARRSRRRSPSRVGVARAHPHVDADAEEERDGDRRENERARSVDQRQAGEDVVRHRQVSLGASTAPRRPRQRHAPGRSSRGERPGRGGHLPGCRKEPMARADRTQVTRGFPAAPTR